MDMAICICSGGRPHEGPAPKRIVTGFGFWIFLLSDIVMFSCFFAAYAVLLGQTAGGPSGAELFDLRSVAAETALLLLSSFTCGLAMIAADVRNARWFQLGMAVTCLFGLGFLALEFREFADLVGRGAGPTRSAFLSAFFTLVGCHGAHVSAGTLWLLTMMAQVFKGYRADTCSACCALRCSGIARHHLGRDLLRRLSIECRMSDQHLHHPGDLAPGDEEELRVGPRACWAM
jgi:cytochrome o ubiquinol oxidase subunit 3